MKKGKILLSVGIMFLIIGIITPLIFFNSTLNSVAYIEKKITLESDYIAKLGLLKTFKEMDKNAEQNSGGESCTFLHCSKRYAIALINEIIDNTYGYTILKTPIKINKMDIDRLSGGLENFNDELIEESKRFNETIWNKAFPKKVFSDKLISTIRNNNYEYGDLILIEQELEKSADLYCKGFIYLLNQSPESMGYMSQNEELLLQLCEAKIGKKLFNKEWLSYNSNLPDVELYENHAYIPLCNEPIYIEEDCQKEGCPTSRDCTLEGQYKDILLGVLKLSNLHISIQEKASDIFISFGDLGNQEVSNINGKFNFEQYGNEILSNQSLGFAGNFAEEKGYIVVSNNENVVKASEGEIEKTSEINNLWDGFKSLRIFKSPSYLIFMGITAISFLTAILFIGFGAVMMARRK
jgi:hypothetical protein